MPTSKIRMFGIDPGYGRLGYAVVDRTGGKETLIAANCIETSSSDPHEKRIRDAGRALERALAEFEPDALAIEKLFLSSNQKTAMRVAEMRGVALYLASHLPVYEFSPPEIKLAICGYGRADKKQVETMVRMLFRTSAGLRDDAIDAIAIAFCALGRVRF